MTYRRQFHMAFIMTLASITSLGTQDSKPLFTGSSAYLGVRLHNVTEPAAKTHGLSEPFAVLVVRAKNDSPAHPPRLKQDDLILSYNGARVESMDQFYRLTRETAVGRAVTLGAPRGRQRFQLQATLRPRQTMDRRRQRFRRLYRPAFNPRFSIRTITLTRQLDECFGVPAGQGVLVASVSERSPAATAGLRAGPVVLAAMHRMSADSEI